MSTSDSHSNTISSVYEELIKQRSAEEIESNLISTVSRLKQFGKETTGYLARKLKSAGQEELEKIFIILPEYDAPQLSDALTHIVEERIVPLDIKLKVFEVMSQLGYSLDDEFLKQLHAAEELYVQLSSYLRSAEEDDYARALSLKEEFFSLPRALKLSVIMETDQRFGEGAKAFLVNLVGEDAEVDSDIIEIVSKGQDVASANVLQRIVESSANKATVKKAKRALYVLKEKGVEPEAVEEELESASRGIDFAESEDPEKAYASSFDSFGGRLALLVMPGMSRLMVCQASIDEKKGLVHFAAMEMPRRKFKEFFKDIREKVQQQTHTSLGEISPDHCRWMLEQAYKQTVSGGGLVPGDFKSLRYRLKLPEGYDPQKTYSEELTADKSKRMLFDKNADDIFQLVEVGIWMIEREQLFPYVKRYIDLAESKLIVSDEQRQEQLDVAVEKYAREYFDEGKIRLFADRMWETALVLSGQNRKEDAGSVVALAESIENHADLSIHPFFKSFMIRSIIGTIQALTAQQQQNAQEQEPSQPDEPKIIT